MHDCKSLISFNKVVKLKNVARFSFDGAVRFPAFPTIFVDKIVSKGRLRKQSA